MNAREWQALQDERRIRHKLADEIEASRDRIVQSIAGKLGVMAGVGAGLAFDAVRDFLRAELVEPTPPPGTLPFVCDFFRRPDDKAWNETAGAACKACGHPRESHEPCTFYRADFREPTKDRRPPCLGCGLPLAVHKREAPCVP
jgi:hypothetical protein